MVELFESRGVPLWISVPPGADRRTRVVISVHGISRNSREHISWLQSFLPSNAAIIAPHFDAEQYPHYQKLGLGADERRADLWLDAALEGLESLHGLDLQRFHLFGFSGGAQFAHRYAMLYPQRMLSLHLAAAGYYTYFQEHAAWPRGLRKAPLAEQARANRNFFLRIPIDVYVGDEDTKRDSSLRKGAAIDKHQGPDRRARAQAWTEHLRQLQSALGTAQANLSLLAGVGHDFGQASQSSALRDCLAQALVNKEAPLRSPLQARATSYALTT